MEIRLLIDVFKLSIPGADHRTLFIEAVLGTRKVEPVGRDGIPALHCRANAALRKFFHAGVIALAVATELATINLRSVISLEVICAPSSV